MIRKLIFILIAVTVLIPSPLIAKGVAKKKGGPVKVKTSYVSDDDDRLGNTCKPGGKCTFTRKDMLPGNISVEIQVVSLGAFRDAVEKVFDYAINDVKRVATILNANDPSSEVSKVNANAGNGYVEVGQEFIRLINVTKKAYLWTNGAFDITATPDIGNFENIKIKGNMVYLKKSGMKISFDSVIHGYIADLIVRAIYNANIDNALVQVGPASRSIGSSVVGNWRTEVVDTEGGYARRGMSIDTSNVSVASVIRGANAPVRDPRWATPPFTPTCRSVTIISRNAVISEAIAYGAYVLGIDKGMQLIKSLQNIRGIIVDNNGNFSKSQGLP